MLFCDWLVSTITAEYCGGSPLYLYTQIERDWIPYYAMFLLLFCIFGHYIYPECWVGAMKRVWGVDSKAYFTTWPKNVKSEQCCWTSARLLSSATLFVTHKSKTESIKINTVNLLIFPHFQLFCGRNIPYLTNVKFGFKSDEKKKFFAQGFFNKIF